MQFDRRSGRSVFSGDTHCAAWTPSCTSRAGPATSRGRRSRSSTASPRSACCAPPSGSAPSTSCGSRRSAPRRTARCGCTGRRRSPPTAIEAAEIPTTTLAHSLMYAPATATCCGWSGSATCRWCRSSGRGIARTQPIWAEDMADVVLAAIEARRTAIAASSWPGRRRSRSARSCGSCSPLRAGAGARSRSRWPGSGPPCGPRRRCAGPLAITWDEAQLLAVEMLSARGTADAEALGVTPAEMATVLGAGVPKGWRIRAA